MSPLAHWVFIAITTAKLSPTIIANICRHHRLNLWVLLSKLVVAIIEAKLCVGIIVKTHGVIIVIIH
jgi:hypothetical protein